ncbi:MAG: hypothetical protein GY801_29680 [bacterium]|nr:hypothetical protein [bacterium]
MMAGAATPLSHSYETDQYYGQFPLDGCGGFSAAEALTIGTCRQFKNVSHYFDLRNNSCSDIGTVEMAQMSDYMKMAGIKMSKHFENACYGGKRILHFLPTRHGENARYCENKG